MKFICLKIIFKRTAIAFAAKSLLIKLIVITLSFSHVDRSPVKLTKFHFILFEIQNLVSQKKDIIDRRFIFWTPHQCLFAKNEYEQL